MAFPVLLSSQVPVFNSDFNSGQGAWISINISDPADAWAPLSGCMEINGFGGGDDEDWLISPPINMNVETDEYLLFDYNDLYPGDLLELFYATDFNGGSSATDVQSANWTNIPLSLLNLNEVSCFSTLLQRHPAIDVSFVSGTSVRFAFKYIGTSSASKRYQIDNFEIEGSYYSSLDFLIQNGWDCSLLKTEVHKVIRKQRDEIRYTSSLYDVWDAFLHTDTRSNDAGNSIIVWDMFTDMPSSTGEMEFEHCANRDNGSCPGGEGVCYNREHSLPKSWWGGGTSLSDTQYVDLHHLVPSDRLLNSWKSNYPPGVVISANNTGSNGFKVGSNFTYPCSSMSYFEPINEYKGDYARIYFFMATRYENKIATWEALNTEGDCALRGDTYLVYEPWLLQVLLDWHAMDPVSQKEIDHNNAVYSIQGNRNPFVDNPQWIQKIWGDNLGTPCAAYTLPIELVLFEAQLKNGRVELKWITASETNNDYFSIERSKDGLDWDVILTMSGAGNSSSMTTYTSLDSSPLNGLSYYRLKQTDYDGQFTYSSIKAIDYQPFNSSQVKLFPNPTTGKIELTGDPSELSVLSVVDMQGKDVTQSISIYRTGDSRVVLDLEVLKSGQYIIGTMTEHKRVIKW
jgi:endonuclease I